ncbi:hypothetical protein IKG45_00340 [Candidatus Saccharibacteria bacterium]|nr:hypothetical protein [Candidatus Saccharibacteria bacterium]
MKYFGTDGIRGKAERFTSDFLSAIVKGLVDYAGEDIKVLIGGDTRESSEWILADLERALETFGIEYASVGVLSTPAINYCFYEMGFDFAIDVTASHNPYTDNGIKIFERGQSSGQKLSDSGCEIIEQSLDNIIKTELVSSTIREDLHFEALEIYKTHLKDYIGDVDLSGLKIGLDCANGATSALNKVVFEEFGAKVNLIHSDENYGRKINKNCGSTHLESLQKLVKEKNLDLGIAFDGDGDRCLLIDSKGEIVDGDQIIAILTKFLGLNSAVVTVMANQGLINWAKKEKINLEITSVGDSNVALAMREKNIELGGEQSGHVILPGESTGDGMLTALLVCKAVVKSQKSFDELAGFFEKLPQIMINMEATPAQKELLKTKEEVKKLLLEYNKKIESVSGRLLVRPSGTENLIRITMWGDDDKKIEKLANGLKKELEEFL